MFRNSQTEIPYDDIDIEIKELVRLLNQFEGIETESCCFGHHKIPCMIYFKAETIEDIVNLSFNLFDCQHLWHIEINTQDIHKDWKDLHFVLHTGDIKDFPTVDLLVNNLTLRVKEELTKLKLSLDLH